jgi:hypothetical protein
VMWVLVIIAPAISVGLTVWSNELTHYRGLSGLATAMTVAAMCTVARAYPSSRPALALLTAAMTLKMIGDTMGISPDLAGLPLGVMVEWRAHVLGAAAGIAATCSGLMQIVQNTSTGAALRA